MKRDLVGLSSKKFDVLVVGGGIHGVICAWDAALRGLSVALIDRGDFGSATSQNSLKIIHGGLRYLPDGNLLRVRAMAVERRTWMKIAPHLVHPLPCITPTYHNFSRSRFAMNIALGVNDLLCYDRNSLSDPQKYLPKGQVVSRQELVKSLPGLDPEELTGAAVWYDAQIYNSERLLLSFVLSAARVGACVANYVEATGFIMKGAIVSGVKARDVLSDQEVEIQAKVVINSCGGWIDDLLKNSKLDRSKPRFIHSVALNLVTRQCWEGYAAGLSSKSERNNGKGDHTKRSQVFFIVPWRQYSLIGTWHLLWPHSPNTFTVTEDVIQDFVEQVNSAHPGLRLALDDVCHVHWGFLPALNMNNHGAGVRLVREGQVIDHQREGGVAGLITILGVKYTTARMIAQRAVNLAVKKSGAKVLSCQTHETPIFGGKIDRFNEFLAKALAETPGFLNPEIIEHLVYTYGAEYHTIIDLVMQQTSLVERVVKSSPVIKAEIVHAVRKEWAQKLDDVIQRRTELGAAGLPEQECLHACAELMGQELGWNENMVEKSIAEVQEAYPFDYQRRMIR